MAKAKKTSSKKDTPEVETPEVIEQVIEEVVETPEVIPESKQEIMRRKLKNQATRRVYIPLEEGEPNGATQQVILNGLRLNVKKGVYVDVPEQVADVIEESQEATAKAHVDAMKKLQDSVKMDFDNS